MLFLREINTLNEKLQSIQQNRVFHVQLIQHTFVHTFVHTFDNRCILIECDSLVTIIIQVIPILQGISIIKRRNTIVVKKKKEFNCMINYAKIYVSR